MKDNDKGLLTERPKRTDFLIVLRRSKYKYVFIVLAANAFFLPMFLIDPYCLAPLVLPLATVLFLYVLKIENFWHQLATGAVAIVVAALFASAAFVPLFFDIDETEVRSTDGVLIQGGVSPLRGDADTLYNYSITVVLQDINATIETHVEIAEFNLFSINERNETMTNYYNGTGIPQNVTYYLETYVNGTYNFHHFAVKINNTWHEAGTIDNNELFLTLAPVTENDLHLFGYFFLAFMLVFAQISFMVLLIMLIFMRFMRRSGEAKKKLLEKYEQARLAKEEAGIERRKPSEGTKKISSISMGPSAEEIFVCSECGSDVPASAKFCPNCGEPFEEDEGEKKE